MKRPWVILGLIALLGPASPIRALEPDQEKELKKIQQLRLDAANLPGAAKQNALKVAMVALENLINNANWAKASMEVRKEKVQILEDMELFGGPNGAILGWDALMKQNKRANPIQKEQYFDCYYHLIYCLYKNSQKVPAGANQQKALTQAATFIVKLEINQPDMGADHLKKRYEELLQKEPVLKAAYLREGGKELVK